MGRYLMHSRLTESLELLQFSKGTILMNLCNVCDMVFVTNSYCDLFLIFLFELDQAN